MSTIVVGASLAESGDPILRAAVSIAGWTGARLHLVHAFQIPAADEPLAADWGFAAFLKEEQEALEQRLLSQLERLGVAPGDLAGWTIEVGTPHRLVVDVAAEIAADLIVVAPHESTGRLLRWLGSTADRVVRKSRCPVWVARGATPRPPERVLLPVDLSRLSAQALDFALELLHPEAGESGPLFEALLVLDSATAKELAFRCRGDSTEIGDLAERDLEIFLAGRSDRAAEVGSRLRVGEVVEAIVAEIEQWRPDLVIMGTHGRGGFERFMIGSIAAGVLRYASCSVLVVPPTEDAGKSDRQEGDER
jgi:nucleotide-binding universal stress UspA family protein